MRNISMLIFNKRLSLRFFKYGSLFILLCSITVAFAQHSSSISVQKIWDKAPYNSFTSLIRFNGAFYCSFREGTSHVGDKNDGKVRILRSKDGNHWESVALLEINGLDLRDPKLSVTPEHQIMVIMAGAVFDHHIKIQKLFPMISFSNKTGIDFSKPEKAKLDPAVSPSKDWIWRMTWHQGTGYGIDYHTIEVSSRDSASKKEPIVTLMETQDGKYFQKVSRLPVNDYPNESTIRFNNNNEMYVLVRREAGDKMGVLLKSVPPYLKWNNKRLKIRLGGPDFLFLDSHQLVIGTRHYGNKGNTTAVLVTDLNGKILKIIDLPSGGDTGYPGLVIYKKILWVSYYSSHEGKTSIYLARIPLRKL